MPNAVLLCGKVKVYEDGSERISLCSCFLCLFLSSVCLQHFCLTSINNIKMITVRKLNLYIVLGLSKCIFLWNRTLRVISNVYLQRSDTLVW